MSRQVLLDRGHGVGAPSGSQCARLCGGWPRWAAKPCARCMVGHRHVQLASDAGHHARASSTVAPSAPRRKPASRKVAEPKNGCRSVMSRSRHRSSSCLLQRQNEG